MRFFAAAAILVALSAAPLAGQDAPPADPEARSPLTAAGWCVVRDSGESEEGAPGCDVGAGLALYRWRQASVVAVIGTETVGAGLAWVAYRPERGPVVAVAAGVVARYDSEGIDAGEVYPALGATLSFGRAVKGGD